MGSSAAREGAAPAPDARDRLRLWLQSGDPPEAHGSDDESLLIESALPQGLAPLLSSAVRMSPSWSSSARARLKAIERASLVRGVRQLDLVRRIQDLLLKRGLRALPLKGAAVVERCYGSVAHRPMGDVDLLALDDWRATYAAMIENGFLAGGRGDHAVVFVDDASGNVVELHHALTSCPSFFRVDKDGWWSRSAPGPGQVPFLPSVEDTLVSMAAHAAFQHGLVLTLSQYLDFTRIVTAAALDVERLLVLASRSRATTALVSALSSVAIVFGDASTLRALETPSLSRHRGLHRRLKKRAAHPLALVVPSRPPLASMRWSLATGRRIELVKLTLLPREPDERLTTLSSLRKATRRLIHVFRRLDKFR
ncbi:MAG: nucleotidyltransferase family protein [Vicinamibacteria bacterium]|nr:nucleotidyltransferase family protein [Vicinamibacteria bacterium]